MDASLLDAHNDLDVPHLDGLVRCQGAITANTNLLDLLGFLAVVVLQYPAGADELITGINNFLKEHIIDYL